MRSVSENPQKNPAEFIRRQLEFAANIRHPENPAPADVEDRRMAIYRDLFYNNVEDFMANSYPVIRELFDDTSWHSMIRDYYSRHQAKTPLFPTMPEEFLNYLEHERNCPEDPPFLLELAHYEWIELALTLSDESISLENIDPNASLLELTPVLSPLALPLSYQFPVHRISTDFQPTTRDGPSFLVVYRNRLDDVKFLEINIVTFRLLQLITEHPHLAGKDILSLLASELPQLDEENVVSNGLKALEDLKAKGIVIGSRQES